MVMTKELLRDGLSTMPLLLKNIPPAKIQTFVSAKWIFFSFLPRNQHWSLVSLNILTDFSCKKQGTLQTLLAWKCS